MEDRTTTDATLRIYRELQPKYGNLGVVFQAYMRRTLADIGAMPREGANVRLCKGIYIEPRTTAWKGYETVRLNFVSGFVFDAIQRNNLVEQLSRFGGRCQGFVEFAACMRPTSARQSLGGGNDNVTV